MSLTDLTCREEDKISMNEKYRGKYSKDLLGHYHSSLISTHVFLWIYVKVTTGGPFFSPQG